MSRASNLIDLAESVGYDYLMTEMTLCAKRGQVGMKLSRDVLEHFKTRLQDDGFEVLYDSVSWAKALRPFNQ